MTLHMKTKVVQHGPRINRHKTKSQTDTQSQKKVRYTETVTDKDIDTVTDTNGSQLLSKNLKGF